MRTTIRIDEDFSTLSSKVEFKSNLELYQYLVKQYFPLFHVNSQGRLISPAGKQYNISEALVQKLFQKFYGIQVGYIGTKEEPVMLNNPVKPRGLPDTYLSRMEDSSLVNYYRTKYDGDLNSFIGLMYSHKVSPERINNISNILRGMEERKQQTSFDLLEDFQ